MNTHTLDWQTYSLLARTAVSEGCVLLRNENNALPIRPRETAAVFGRIQLDYYKSGTGSGGMVNVPYVHSILDGLRQHPQIRIYEPLLARYRAWTSEHPFDRGTGWGTEPWCQEEMPLTDEIVSDAAAHSDLALIILGRTAGEDRDNSASEGSYYLTAMEREMLLKVCHAFHRTAVILNTGNIIDMSWVEEFRPSAVLYAWQGGMEGGLGVADLLCGTVSPSGKLSDTIARELRDYPAIQNFGSESANIYQEDIYTGYRYFETFARSRVLYPFGFGLSYTTFRVSASMEEHGHELLVTAVVENTGSFAGKEVVQVYVCPPQGLLGKPLRSLCAFAKTGELGPGETEVLTMTIEKQALASYDDGGVTGYKSCYVLESGCYRLYAGTDVRTAGLTGSFEVPETLVVERCQEAIAPVTPFCRLRPGRLSEDGQEYEPAFEAVPLRTVAPALRRRENLPSCLPFSGDRGYTLYDVKKGCVSMDEFLAQLSDEDLMHLANGEGMCSTKVTPGTAGAFGGLTESLRHFGIPAGCCSDGPSGIRMDCGASAFSLPNGTALACTFDPALVTELFAMEGLELYANQIDTLLGPGINIHRSPLNGRNFEYHSEDPYLTGQMAAAQLTGMNRHHSTGTMKHFCANNQEYCRHQVNSIVSERALREIYLKPFELGVKNGQARSIMTSYGPVNGIWTAGNYDLNTTLLRHEWGFQGIVMTDWWARANDEGCEPDRTNRAAMIRAQNDLFMVTPDTTTDANNLAKALAEGTLTRAELIRSAANVCTFLMASPAMERVAGTYEPVVHVNQPADLSCLSEEDTVYHTVTADTTLPLEDCCTAGGTAFLMALSFEEEGNYCFKLCASVTPDTSELAQIAVTLSLDGTLLHTYSYCGSHRVPVTIDSNEKDVRGTTHYLKFYFSLGGLQLHTLQIQKVSELKAIM